MPVDTDNGNYLSTLIGLSPEEQLAKLKQMVSTLEKKYQLVGIIDIAFSSIVSGIQIGRHHNYLINRKHLLVRQFSKTANSMMTILYLTPKQRQYNYLVRTSNLIFS
jgi:hypothetical protein